MTKKIPLTPRARQQGSMPLWDSSDEPSIGRQSNYRSVHLNFAAQPCRLVRQDPLDRFGLSGHPKRRQLDEFSARSAATEITSD